MTAICEHCGVDGIQVARCESYRLPHLCPNDHITHCRSDLFCQKCEASLVSGVCPNCTALAESAEYRLYHKAVVNELARMTGYRNRSFWNGCEFFQGFVDKRPPTDEAYEQATAGN